MVTRVRRDGLFAFRFTHIQSINKNLHGSFLQLAFDLFLGSRTIMSWLRNNELNEGNRLDVKFEATIGALLS